MKIALLAAASIALLTACGPKTETTPAADASGNHDAAGPISEAKLGVKIYPGAKIVTSGETDEVVSANLRSSAPLADIVTFYEKELSATASGDASLTTITAKKANRAYAVSMTTEGGETSISIMGKK